jgi:hypothetical protein
MRGVVVLAAYLIGLGAIISFGIAGLMALQPSTKPAPKSVAAAAPEQIAKPIKQTTQKAAQAVHKHKTVHAARRRMEDAPTVSPSARDAYGYANEPRRSYSPFFWSRQ